MHTAPTVRLARSEDTAAVRACVIAAFEHYIERIGKPPGPMLLDFEEETRASHVWVATADDRIVGVLVQYETDLGFYIDTVAALPSVQGTGVGRELLVFAEREAMRHGYDSLYLCTNSKMTENQAFYPRIGYVEYERKQEAGFDRVFYRKHLSHQRNSGAA